MNLEHRIKDQLNEIENKGLKRKLASPQMIDLSSDGRNFEEFCGNFEKAFMSEEEIKKLIETNLEKQTVSTETGLQVADKLKQIASAENVDFAIAGGLAMHLYGFVRATLDVDFIANRRISLEAKRHLIFGGERYEVEIDGRKIDTDWIVRKDKYAEIYVQALKDSTEIDGRKIILPEWLVILKYAAGRGKDRLDLLWLLQQKKLVDRRKIAQLLKNLLGELGAIGFLTGLQREYDLADVMGARATGDENESYIPDEDYSEYNE